MGTQPNPTDLLAQQVRETQELKALVQQLMERLDRVERVRVKVVDVNMPFFNLVGLIVKVALAAVPAAILLSVLGWVVLVLVGSGCSALVQGM